MGKKSKSYRGQRAFKESRFGCGCYYCTGDNKNDKYKKMEKQIIKEIKISIEEKGTI